MQRPAHELPRTENTGITRNALRSSPSRIPPSVDASRNMHHNPTILATPPRIHNSNLAQGDSVQSNASIASKHIPAVIIGYKNVMQPSNPKGFPFRDRVMNFYHTYCPSKMSIVDELLSKYKGNEIGIMEGLVKKYGPEPPMMVPRKIPVLGTPMTTGFVVSQPSAQIPVVLFPPTPVRSTPPKSFPKGPFHPIPESGSTSKIESFTSPKCAPKSPQSVKKGPPPWALKRKTSIEVASSPVASDSAHVITVETHDGDIQSPHKNFPQKQVKFPPEIEKGIGVVGSLPQAPSTGIFIETRSIDATSNSAPSNSEIEGVKNDTATPNKMPLSRTTQSVGTPGAKLAQMLSKYKVSNSDSDSESPGKDDSEGIHKSHISCPEDRIDHNVVDEDLISPTTPAVLNSNFSEVTGNVVQKGNNSDGENNPKLTPNVSSGENVHYDIKVTEEEDEPVEKEEVPDSDADNVVHSMEAGPIDIVETTKYLDNESGDNNVLFGTNPPETAASATPETAASATPEISSLATVAPIIIKRTQSIVNRKPLVKIESLDEGGGKGNTNLKFHKQNGDRVNDRGSKSTNELPADLKHTLVVNSRASTHSNGNDGITPDKNRISPLIKRETALLASASIVAKDVMFPLRPYKSPYKRLRQQHDEALSAHIETELVNQSKALNQRKLLASSPVVRRPSPNGQLSGVNKVHVQGRSVSVNRVRSSSAQREKRCANSIPDRESKSVTIDYRRNNMMIVDRRYFSPNIKRPSEMDSVLGVPRDRIKGAILIGKVGGHGPLSGRSPGRGTPDDRRRGSSLHDEKSAGRDANDSGVSIKLASADGAYTRNYVSTFRVKNPQLPSVWAAPRLKESILQDIRNDISKGALEQITAFHPVEADNDLGSKSLSFGDEKESENEGRSNSCHNAKQRPECDLKGNSRPVRSPTRVIHNWRSGEIVVESPLDKDTGLRATTIIQTRSGLGSLRSAAADDINKNLFHKNVQATALSDKTKGLRVVRIIKKVPIGEEALKQQEISAKRLSRPKPRIAYNSQNK